MHSRPAHGWPQPGRSSEKEFTWVFLARCEGCEPGRGLGGSAWGGGDGHDDSRVMAVHADEGKEGVATGGALEDGRRDMAAAIAMGARA